MLEKSTSRQRLPFCGWEEADTTQTQPCPTLLMLRSQSFLQKKPQKTKNQKNTNNWHRTRSFRAEPTEASLRKGAGEDALEFIQVRGGGGGSRGRTHRAPRRRGPQPRSQEALAVQYEMRGRGLPDGGRLGSAVPLATQRGRIRGAAAGPPSTAAFQAAATAAAAPAYIKT